MNFTQVWSKAALLAAITAALGLSASATMAQQAVPNGIAPPPPELQKLEEGEPPAVTIKKPGEERTNGNSITERRDHGQTKEVKVQSGPSTYYLKPKEQVGSAMPGDAQSGPPTAAQWKIKEFDMGGKKKPEKGEAGDNSNNVDNSK